MVAHVGVTPNPMMKRTHHFALLATTTLLTAWSATSCRPAPSPAVEQTPAAAAASVPEAVRSVYPVDPGLLDPLAVRLCEALHVLPETRKAECCQAAPASTLAGECARTLTVAIGDGSVALSRVDVDRCVQASATELAGCDWVTPLAPRTPAACQRLLRGTVTGGGTCRSSLDCVSGLFCSGASPTTAGTCSAPGVTGAACGGPTDTLATYVKQAAYEADHPECEGFCRAGRCASFLADGDACSSDRQCGTDAYCSRGRCTAGLRPVAGQPCTGGCRDGAVCVAGTCVALKATGASCSSPFECQASCVIAPGATAGVCGPQCVSPAITGLPPATAVPRR